MNKEFDMFENLKFKLQSIMDDIMTKHYKIAQDMLNTLIFIETNSIDQKHPGEPSFFQLLPDFINSHHRISKFFLY